MKLDPITANFLGVLAQNRRLAQLAGVIRAFNLLAARHRGEITAEVTSAHPLDDGQVDALKQNLRTRDGPRHRRRPQRRSRHPRRARRQDRQPA